MKRQPYIPTPRRTEPLKAILAAQRVLSQRQPEATSKAFARVQRYLRLTALVGQVNNGDIPAAIQSIVDSSSEDRENVRTVAKAMLALLEELDGVTQTDLIVSERVAVTKDGQLVVS